MDIDIEFLKKTVDARRDVGRWLTERPNVGLDVTDVATMVQGFDYLVEIIKNVTGTDLAGPDQVGYSSMEITFLDDAQ